MTSKLRHLVLLPPVPECDRANHDGPATLKHGTSIPGWTHAQDTLAVNINTAPSRAATTLPHIALPFPTMAASSHRSSYDIVTQVDSYAPS